jgi:UDP-glucose 4-epimerase
MKNNFNSSSANILITGCYGFIGRNLSLFLKKKKINVYGIGNIKKEFVHKNFGCIKIINGRIKKKKIIKFKIKFDFIIHCAGSGRIGFSQKNDFNKNIKPTTAILKYVQSFSPNTKIIIMSSAAVYGNNKKKFTEKTKIKPISVYGRNKYLAEKKSFIYSKKFGLNILIIRLTSIYGEGMNKQLIFESCNKVKKNYNQFFGTGNEVRDWLHINDLSNLIYKIIKKNFHGFSIYNCGSGRGYKVKDVINFIIKKNKKKITPIFSGKGLKQNPLSNVTSIQKLKYFNWKPKKNFWTGISDYIKYYNNKKD